MNEERRKSERRVPPAVVEFAVEERQQLLEKIADQAREIERLRDHKNEYMDAAEATKRALLAELAALKAQPSGVVLPERDDVIRKAVGMCNRIPGSTTWNAAEYAYDEFVARLNSSPVSAGGVDERAAFEAAVSKDYPVAEFDRIGGSAYRVTWIREMWAGWQARAALTASGPNHSEQMRHMVREGWQLVPVEPTDAMLEAGDKYIGTPATYKSMLSACPSPAITKDFSQFLSAVMDAAGLIRHGRQSKELSGYLGMKCMEYRGVAPSLASQKEQG